MPHYNDDDDLYSSSSSFLSPATHSRKSPSKPSLSIRKSSASLRPQATPVNGSTDDAPNGRHHSLAHELAVAMMPEPSAGSRLLAEEFGIEFDEGAEGIDELEEPEHDDHTPDNKDVHDVLLATPDTTNLPIPSFADELVAQTHEASFEVQSPDAADEEPDLDPVFHSPTNHRSQRTRHRTPEKDAMDILSENLEFSDKFLVQLRTLDTDPSSSSSQQPRLERLAADILRRMNENAREREHQVRDMLACEREFRKIAAEVGGDDLLGHLDELEQIDGLLDPAPSSTSNSQPPRVESRQLHTLEEEPSSPGAHNNSFNDWELDPHGNHLGDADFDSSPVTSPIKDSFPPPPQINGPVTPAKAIAQLSHIRSYTTTVASSLSAISEHAQVTGVATTDAGRKIRSLKNKLGDLRAEWDSAERSRAKIEKWEAGVIEDGKSVLLSPSRASKRLDGRKIVQEHLQAFEQALVEAALKTQAIMAR
ncbi:hypothetical protein FA15DRAFT_667711 [Coprinopsis marcescibilis]|uniref:Uncharacterized protein n=1 Tax=Coprinopsis marcescibilis TaxID=230819 RepID=A0A5C3L0S1_COPMA|nr:hypothetical protein FA15DRAFT_667711 [Coprinopsis marcescibilis]